jgi:hypothetical protein
MKWRFAGGTIAEPDSQKGPGIAKRIIIIRCGLGLAILLFQDLKHLHGNADTESRKGMWTKRFTDGWLITWCH